MNRVLITTPDYPPHKVGGISTFVINLEKVIKRLPCTYEVFVWNKPSDVREIDLSQYDLVINAHFHCLLFLNHSNMLTFVHGGELLSYSKNPIKRLLKWLGHKKILDSMKRSRHNIFISEFTFNLYRSLGAEADYCRDIVFHNCIDTELAEFVEKSFDNEITICSFVRDVPHKNVSGILKTFHAIKNRHPHKVSLYITADLAGENIFNISNCDNDKREEVLKTSHLNLLMSLDHTHIGNVEGFGLTVLESGKYGVPTIGLSSGGLVESIHHNKTGVLADQSKDLYQDLKDNFSKLSKNVYNHTTHSHSLDQLENLLRAFI